MVLRLHKMKFKNSSQFWHGPFANVGFLYFLSQVLEDVCQKNQWGSPVYTLHSTVGPQDMQLFLHKVGLIFLLHYFEPNIKCCENWICLLLDFLWPAAPKQCDPPSQPYPLCFFKNHFIFFLNLIISISPKENNLVWWVSLSDISISMVLLSSVNIYVHL